MKILSALLLLISVDAFGANPKAKAPWEWTTEERLTVRADASKAAERFSRSEQGGGRVQTLGARSRVVDVIDGKVNPELFLPHELFESFIERCFVIKDRQVWRDAHEPQLIGLGFPEDVWTRIEKLAGLYLDDLKSNHATLIAATDEETRLRANEQVASTFPALCHDRAVALAAVRHELGPAFDRFLYQYCAPMRSSYLEELTNPTIALSLERGCK